MWAVISLEMRLHKALKNIEVQNSRNPAKNGKGHQPDGGLWLLCWWRFIPQTPVPFRGLATSHQNRVKYEEFAGYLSQEPYFSGRN